MKGKRKNHIRKVVALILALCMIIGQSQGVFADNAVSAGDQDTHRIEEKIYSEALAEAAAEEESIVSDEPVSGAEDGEVIDGGVRDVSLAESRILDEIRGDALAAEVSAEVPSENRAFDYSHLKFNWVGAEGMGLTKTYTGREIRPELEVYWSPSENETDKTKFEKLTEGKDYNIVQFTDNMNLGVARVLLRPDGIYTGDDLEWGFIIAPNPDLVEVTPGSTSVTFKNKHEKNSSNTLYVAVVSMDGITGDPATQTYPTVVGKAVESGGGTAEITSYYYEDSDHKVQSSPIQPETKYLVYAAEYEDMYVDDEAVAWEGTVKKETVTEKKSSEPETTTLKDGSDPAISFKALTQKDQSVKLSWTPSKTSGYKTFALYRLKDDATDLEDAGSWKTLMDPGSKKKAYTDKDNVYSVGANPAKSGVYKLTANHGAGDTSYIMVAAPWLYKTESGEAVGTQDFTFTALRKSQALSYNLEIASVNKEKEKDPNGFGDPTRVTSVRSEDAETSQYTIKKGLTSEAAKTLYGAEAPRIGVKYFFRVKSVFAYRNLTVTSYASNVLNRKVGPAKCTVFSIDGLSLHDQIEQTEASHIADMFAGKDIPSLQGVHADSDGTCWKKGYITFRYEGDFNDVKEFQLLRSTTEDGKLKVVRKYSTSNSTLFGKLNDADYARMNELRVEALGTEQGEKYYSYMKDYYEKCLWVEYDDFTPEVEYYYTMRAVSKTGNVTGDCGPVMLNKTKFEKVQNLIVVDSGCNSIYLAWKHDDCAKEYWVYRDTVSGNFKNVTGATKPVLKVKGSKYEEIDIPNAEGEAITQKTHIAYDMTAGGGKEYYYMVRPIYKNNKSDNYQKFSYAVACSEEAVKATIGELYVKTITPAVYSVKQLQVKWSGVVNNEDKKNPVDAYQIELLDGTVSKGKWEVQKNDPATKKAFNARSFLIPTLVEKVGHEYTIMVRPKLGDEYGDKDGKGKVTAKTYPLAAANLKVSKQTGSNFENGAKITFEINSKDRDYADNIWYEVTSGSRTIKEGFFSDSNNCKVSFADSDYLSRGATRGYKVKTTYVEGSDRTDGKTTSVSYSKPDRVKLRSGSGNDHKNDLEVGDTYHVYAYFEANGSPATVQDYDEIKSSDSDIVKIKDISYDSDNKRWDIKVKAEGSGSAKIKIKGYQHNWGGISDEFKITVKKSSSSSSSSSSR